MAGYTYRGNRRKYEGEQADYMEKLSKAHPKVEVMAGGGAIVAKTGQRVSLFEADIIATRAERPEAAAQAAAQALEPARVSSAEAAAGEASSAMDVPVPDSDEEFPNRAEAD